VRTRGIFLVGYLLAALTAASPAYAYVKGHSHARPHGKPHAVAKLRVAPADEYFGRLKMSILGIGNQLHDLDLKLQFTPEKSEDVIGAASMVEDAIHDWEHKYPLDPWLPKDVFKLTLLYSHIHTDHGHNVALRAMRWLQHRYPKSPYAAQARTQFGTVI
jgi:hypothetical protein